jgi:hypothetical protein
MPSEYRARLRYSEPMLRKAVRTFVWRASILRRWWQWLIAILLGAYVLGPGWDARFPVLNSVFLAGVLALPLLSLVVWRAHFVNTVGIFRRMNPPEADFTFREQDMTVVSSLGTVTLPWSRFVDVWELPGFWMMFAAANQFVTLPTGQLSEETLHFLRSRLPAKR